MLASGTASLIKGIAVKKWLVAVLVILALLVLIAPGIVGRLAERNIEENIDWAESDSPGVRIETERFERGWFTSAGTYRVVLEGGRFAEVSEQYRDATGNPELPSLIISTELAHGPLPGGSLPPGLASTVSTFQIDPGNGQPFDVPGRLTSKVGLDGHSDSNLILEAGSYEHDDATIEWQGVDMNIVSNPRPGSVVVEGEIKPWRIDGGGSIVEFSGVNIKANQVRSEFGFNVGTVEMDMGRVELVDDGVPMSIESITLVGESAIDGDRVNAHSTFAMNTMTIPAVGEVSLDVEFALEGADAASASAIGDAIQDAQSADDPEAALANLYPSIEDELGVLFNRGFTMRLDKLDIALPQGVVSTTVDLSIPENDSDAEFNWSTVLLRMTGKIDMRIPGPIYQMAAMMNAQAGSLVAMGILVQDGEDYVMNAEYAQGLFNVNGSPMPIPMPQ
jgi:uncharacterized protein YdgA (DUF945 family)